MLNKKMIVNTFSMFAFLLFGLLLYAALTPGRTAHAAPAVAPVVNTLIDENDGCAVGDCSLREAITDAAAGDRITFDVSGTIVLSSILGELDIDKDLTIDGGGVIIVSGDDAVRVFNVTAGNVTFDSLTIVDGNVQTEDCGIVGYDTCGGGIRLDGNPVGVTVKNSTLSGNSADFGGGIYNRTGGTLTVTNSTLSGNSAFYGGGIYNLGGSVTVSNSTLSGNSGNLLGGGIFNERGAMTVTNSTISGNSADHGGGISNRGTMTVSNSTLSGNSADSGGGIDNRNKTVTVNNSTISDNRARTRGGGISSRGDDRTFTTIGNTIVSGNVISGTATADDLALALDTTNSFSSGGHNLIGEIGDNIIFAGQDDQTGVTDPKLSPLADNGGDTFTHALMSNSLAIDSGECSSGPAADQRGVTRPQEDSCDIGAYEQICTMTVINKKSSGSGSLRETIARVCDGGLISFDNGLANSTIDISPDGELLINKSVTISGNVPVTVSGSNTVRVFNVTDGNVVFDSLTIANGNVQSNDCGVLSEKCGGGIMLQNSGVAVTVRDSTLYGNAADLGGGIGNNGVVTVDNSTISANSAAGSGGGIFNFSSGRVTVSSSTLSDNRVGTSGGGISSWGNSATVTTIGNSIVAGNVNSGTNTADDLALFALTSNSFSSGGYNLIGAIGDNITFAGTGDQTGINEPLLGPLAVNGGEAMTRALLPGSPAIDAGGNCGVAADQRGIDRSQGSACDSGAFESRGFVLAVTGGSSQTTAINTPFAIPLALTVSSTHDEPVEGGQVSFSAPASGPGVTFTETVAAIGSGGAVSLPVTANGTVGSYDVEADTIGNNGAALNYDLTNELPTYEVFLPVVMK